MSFHLVEPVQYSATKLHELRASAVTAPAFEGFFTDLPASGQLSRGKMHAVLHRGRRARRSGPRCGAVATLGAHGEPFSRHAPRGSRFRERGKSPCFRTRPQTTAGLLKIAHAFCRVGATLLAKSAVGECRGGSGARDRIDIARPLDDIGIVNSRSSWLNIASAIPTRNRVPSPRTSA